MKHSVHVTVSILVEIDDKDLISEFGKATKKLVLQEAINRAKFENAFDTSASVFESYKDEVKKVKRGIGSY